jgi:hypothetical protein
MKGTLRILDATGHTDVVWDTSETATVEAAKEAFAEALLEGRLAIAGGKLVDELDLTQEKTTVLPLMVGG